MTFSLKNNTILPFHNIEAPIQDHLCFVDFHGVVFEILDSDIPQCSFSSCRCFESRTRLILKTHLQRREVVAINMDWSDVKFGEPTSSR